MSTAVIGACTSDDSGSLRVTAPTPAPTPIVPYVVVTGYAASNCQGTFSDVVNIVIGACTQLPDYDVYGVASVSGTVRQIAINIVCAALWLCVG
jgi:hypothetical protein